ncbi:hypothetical protein [Thiohalocapsa sp. ML1]|jgi:hypothetical protein|uniref:hypothetical protein n=1 Tax=Thiohalocapsa sp. ML1 TaxID=1431688 RepID=UPI0007323725|nr:hypothetical protein [Thiohalocapsa sp. ML1]
MANPAAELGALFAQALGSGLVVDLIMLLVLAEALLLWWLRRRFRRGPGLGPVWPTLVSGVLLLLVARAALTGATWQSIALLLALAGLSHLLDLVLRARRRDRASA